MNLPDPAPTRSLAHDGGTDATARPGRTLPGWCLLAVGCALLLGAMVVSTGSGALSIGPGATARALAAGLSGRASELTGSAAICWNLRFPRVLMAALVGASLGASGAALQGMFRNPLAEPYILGAASGASLGATIVMSLCGQLGPAFSLGPFEPHGAAANLVPPAAFLGCAGAVLLTVSLCRGGRRASATSVLLAGSVVSSVLLSATTYLMIRDADRLRAVVFWTLGNLSLAGFSELGTAFPYALAGILVLCALARGLDALSLGEDTARTLGVHARVLQIGIIAGASLATASAVAFVGVIGFVGLVAPHVMRRIGPPTHQVLVPSSALAGAVLLVLADLGARTLARPAELPIGVVTAWLGGPFFLWLLRRQT